MKQKLIKAVLMLPFVLVSQNFTASDEVIVHAKEPIELKIQKLKLEHTNNKIIEIGSKIEMELYIKEFKKR